MFYRCMRGLWGCNDVEVCFKGMLVNVLFLGGIMGFFRCYYSNKGGGSRNNFLLVLKYKVVFFLKFWFIFFF